MYRKISDETKCLIDELNAGNLPVAEIARRANVSYTAVYGYTRLRQRVNPETGRKYKSKTEYEDYHARQRQEKLGNKKLSVLIKRRLKELGKNQSWLAEELGATRQAIFLYAKGKCFPSDSILERLYTALGVSILNVR